MSILPFPASRCSRLSSPATRRALPLGKLADLLVDGAVGTGLMLVGIVPAGDDAIDLHVQPIRDRRLESCIGWHAPPEWQAAGLLGETMGFIADAGTSAVAHELAVALLVDRQGDVVVRRAAYVDGASRVHLPHERMSPTDDEFRQPTGRFVGFCHRLLQLPTPPAPASPGRVWTAVWFDAVLTLVTERSPGERSLRWREVAQCHPVPAALSLRDPLRPEHLVQLAEHPLAESWEAVRLATIAGEWQWPDTPVGAAEWFDAGSFGRWLLDLYPEPTTLLAALADMVSPSVHLQLRQVAQAWGALGDNGSR